MSPRRGRWRPMQDAVWLLIAITTVSMVITLHLGDGLGWLGSGSQVKVMNPEPPSESDDSQVLYRFDSAIYNNSRASSNSSNIFPATAITNGRAASLPTIPTERRRTAPNSRRDKTGLSSEDHNPRRVIHNGSANDTKTFLHLTLFGRPGGAAAAVKKRDKGNYSDGREGRTRLSWKPVRIRGDYHLAEPTALKADTGSARTTEHKTEVVADRLSLRERIGQFPSHLDSGKETAGNHPIPEQGIDLEIGLSENSEVKTGQGENPGPYHRIKEEEDVGPGGNGEEKDRMEENSRTKQTSSGGEEGRLSHLFNGGVIGKDTASSRREDLQARVTYTRPPGPWARPTMGPNNAPVSAMSGSALTTRITVATGTSQAPAELPGEEHGRKQEEEMVSRQALYDHISQVEEPSVQTPETAAHVLVQGPLLAIKHHLPLIESAFQKHKAQVSFSARDGHSGRNSRTNPQASSWSIVLCLNSTGKGEDCVVTIEGRQQAKVNVIPELQEVLMSPTLLCVTGAAAEHDGNDAGRESNDHADAVARDQGQWCGGPLPCYPLASPPASSLTPQTNTRANDIPEPDETRASLWCRGSGGVWLASAASGASLKPMAGSYLPCVDGHWQDPTLAQEMLRLAPRGSALIPLPRDLLTVDGQSALAWQAKVLVSSLWPAARVYIHPNGLVWEGLTNPTSQRHQKALTLSELYQLMVELGQRDKSHLSTDRLHNAVMNVIHLAQKQILKEANGEPPLIHNLKSFQLYDAVFVFNSSFYPFILQTLPSTYPGGLSSLSEYLQEKNVFEDLAPMLLAREKTASLIADALLSLGFVTFKNGQPCKGQNGACIGPSLLRFLLDTRREQASSQNWRRVAPSTERACPSQAKESIKPQLDPDYAMEDLALAVEMLVMCPSQVRLNGTSIVSSSTDIPQNQEHQFAEETRLANGALETETLQGRPCDTDPTTAPHLRAIWTHPYLQLYPEFSPLNTEYQAFAYYNTTVFFLQGVPANCRTKARLVDIEDGKRSGSGHLSLGLGENVIHILVEASGDQVQPVSLSTYKLTIHRSTADEVFEKSAFTEAESVQQKQVCALKQDCDLGYLPGEACGLMLWSPSGQQTATSAYTWDQLHQHLATLPVCRSGSAYYDSGDARWLVPCRTCVDVTSCTWKDAVWHQGSCREAKLSQTQLQGCFKGKQVLFIGDSTNRGILNYITNRLNGSLQEWDKTHTMRVYSGLNRGRSVFGFAYYPQFWLPLDQRPFFDVAFSKLRERSMSAVKGQWDTVLVVGGVHWLTKRHLQSLQARLKRDGLRDVKIVVKGLGAGFHQSVTGIRQLSLSDQQKLYYKNQELLSYARSQGFHIVDTFAMTMARFRDFRQGKCACHFHKVSADQASVMGRLFPRAAYHKAQAPPTSTHDRTYKVEGEINAAYSEMVINRICLD